jgi:hypothetical protein
MRESAAKRYQTSGASLSHLARLTSREQNLAGLVCDGHSNQEIANEIGLSLETKKNIFILSSASCGTWTHDYPITCERARALGLPVNTNMPENILRLMELYPQPMRRQPSVEYVPLPYRTKRPAAPAP